MEDDLGNPLAPMTYTDGEMGTSPQVSSWSQTSTIIAMMNNTSLTSQSLYTAIDALHDELLSDIFLIVSHSLPFWKSANGLLGPDSQASYAEVVEHMEHDTVFIGPLLDEGPCMFTRVCKRWRKVVLSSFHLTLWSHVKITLELRWDTQDEQSRHFSMVSTWLKLSKNVPLMLHLHIKGNERIPADLLRIIDRWRALHLSWAKANSNDPLRQPAHFSHL